jgi:glycosyltransferase involved in cell wall biosynthesis
VFLRLLTQQGSASSVPLISVIPEAVDTNLFDPSFMRTGTARSIVGIDRHLLVDGSRLQNTTAPLDTVVVSRQCGFSGHQVLCNSGKFEFLTIFKWEYRKGWDVLLDAYWAAFQSTDHVVLRVRSYVPLTSGGDRNITRLIEKYALSTLGVPLSELAAVVWENGVQGFTTSRADFSEDVRDALSASDLDAAAPMKSDESDAPPKETHLTREDMRDLLASASAFVLATRGEGWGLPVAEAMSMALPVIVTNHSGPAAFATEENAYLIPTLPDLDKLSFAQPDMAALVNILRQVVFDSGEEGGYVAQAKGRAGRETMKEISPDSIVCKMNERIRYHARMRGWLF